jgi:hypothetical protein
MKFWYYLTRPFILFYHFVQGQRKHKEAWEHDVETRAFKVLKLPALPGTFSKIHYEPGTQKIDVDAAERGILHCFEKAACAGYVDDIANHDIHIIVFKGELSPEQKIPSYREMITETSGYFNSEFDQMKGSKKWPHYIFAAGQMLTAGTPWGDSIIIPDNCNAEETARICEYEFEHIILAWNDPIKFEETKIHGMGAGHPILSECV